VTSYNLGLEKEWVYSHKQKSQKKWRKKISGKAYCVNKQMIYIEHQNQQITNHQDTGPKSFLDPPTDCEEKEHHTPYMLALQC